MYESSDMFEINDVMVWLAVAGVSSKLRTSKFPRGYLFDSKESRHLNIITVVSHERRRERQKKVGESVA